MDPGFFSVYLLGLKYGRARDTLSSLYIVGVKYGEHTLDFPLYICLGKVRRTGDRPWVFLYISVAVDVRRTGDTPLDFILYLCWG
jgi:hypothetical protein